MTASNASTAHATTNTLARIADRYWLVRDDYATVHGVVVRHDDYYIAHYNNQLPTALACIDAVIDYVDSDREHTIDCRLTPELITRLATTTADRTSL